MKFSELKADNWMELAPYLDTALLPVTGLTGHESPPDAADRIAMTGEWLLPLETAYRGRTVTLPAFHYIGLSDRDEAARLERLCGRIKEAGYRYLIVVNGTGGIAEAGLPSADLVIQPLNETDAPDLEAIRHSVGAMWRG